MTNEELLQSILNITIDRMAKQAAKYETEIANLNAQIFMLTDQTNSEDANTENTIEES